MTFEAATELLAELEAIESPTQEQIATIGLLKVALEEYTILDETQQLAITTEVIGIDLRCLWDKRLTSLLLLPNQRKVEYKSTRSINDILPERNFECLLPGNLTPIQEVLYVITELLKQRWENALGS